MSARTGHPPVVADVLIGAHLVAYDVACKRYRAAVALRRQNPHAAAPVPPQLTADRVAAEIMQTEANTVKETA